jgi:hypothetical protein
LRNVPGVVRIGVSGHRQLDDPHALGSLVDEVLDELGEGGTIVSSVAEGADRLVAWRALQRPGWRLVAVLPLPPDDYADDFDSDESRADFAALLDAAAEVEQVPDQPTRDDAYHAAGVRVLERSEVLIAVWDGAPARGRGGTAEIVQLARDEGRPLAWLNTSGAAPVLTRERWRWGRDA